MLLSNQQKYILEILKEFKYLRVRQLHAMVRTHYRAQGIEIDARRMEIMLRQCSATRFLRNSDRIIEKK